LSLPLTGCFVMVSMLLAGHEVQRFSILPLPRFDAFGARWQLPQRTLLIVLFSGRECNCSDR
jgi:hypothetical protein